MARFDVYENPDGEGLLLDIQTDLLSHLNTRIVVPLLPASISPKPAKTLNPCFTLFDESLVMNSQFMAAVPVNILCKPVGSLANHRDEIVAAVDFLMQGF